ncbi:Uncharacterized protein OS=Rhodopirellula sp. SWK7 GN=RRSWK_03312 PE=4 SV=1 [Gemmata massiliana]|uniref:Uncharacterized protein n=1 Tax=Gemmata massiliana TaxID=1210884 RepID=A0A6P2CYN1_9BACT|nr:Uncharacterized protein OS=Rhodopirellula sp. SWK7 GN=RRSWK_03312 PE=4 SV=1 [Gemmata massiliana]
MGTCVASLQASASFGPMMAAEAQERNFYAAPRRAFVADGSAYNWSVHRGYFGTFEPITDFLHAVCYVFSSVAAVSPDEATGWPRYLAWIRACWQGRVGDVRAELSRGRRAWVSHRRARRRHPRSAGIRAGWWPRRGPTWGTIGIAWRTHGTDETGYRRPAAWSSRWWAKSMRW